VILAVGPGTRGMASLELRSDGRLARDEWGRTPGERNVYCAGGAALGGRMAARAVADGIDVGLAVATGQPLGRSAGSVSSRGRHAASFESRTARTGSPAAPAPGDGLPVREPGDPPEEAARCLQCDCAAAQSCALRSISSTYGAKQKPVRAPVLPERIEGTRVVFEPGKCILCGRCVDLTAPGGQGMIFVGRSTALRVAPALGDDLDLALGEQAAACVRSCPTGALVWRPRGGG
jgi:ferredoxin